MEWEIQLNAGGWKEWLLKMEQEVTAARDLLDILETEGQVLGDIWEGAAMKQWESGWREQITLLRTCLREMGELLLILDEGAYALAKLEAGMALAAEKLPAE